LTTYTLSQALRHKGHLEVQLNELIQELQNSKMYYLPDGEADLVGIRKKIFTVAEKISNLSAAIQTVNTKNGLVQKLIRKNVMHREIAALKPEKDSHSFRYDTRKEDTLVLKIHSVLKDGTYRDILAEEYHRLNDELQAANATLTIEIE